MAEKPPRNSRTPAADPSAPVGAHRAGGSGIRASAAYADAIQNDPASQAALARAQARVVVFGLAARSLAPIRAVVATMTGQFQRIMNEARGAADAKMARALAKLRRELATQRAEWEKTYGEPYPRAIEDIIRWSSRLNDSLSESGRQTLADLLPRIEGYLLRRADARGGAIGGAGTPHWTLRLTPGAAKLWECLSGRCMQAADLAKREALDTSPQEVRERVAQIRSKSGDRKVIESRPGFGYFRPDKPPDWNAVKPKRRRRIGRP